MPKKLQLLVVDDDEDFSRDFAVLSRDLFDITLASTGEEALLLLDEDVPDAVILDLRLGSGIDGLETLRKIRSTHFDLPVIMVTQYATVETAVEAMKLGAFHYISKHPNMKELYAIIERELRNAGWKSLFLEEVHKQYGEMVGKSPAMKKIYQVISRAAPTSINILIEGENGTGKELVAREIHARSGRAQHPFVAVNCAAIPATLFESVLFGHEKGAFTNALRRTVGKFETAENGTIFLDEVSTLTQDLQAKLLRVLEDKTFYRVGGNDSIEVNTRVISATNKHLSDEVTKGSFREDLYYRICGLDMTVPPLRERKEDIPRLASYFARRIALQLNRKDQGFTPGAVKAMNKYEWPGNVRELRNVIERSMVLAGDRLIRPEDLNLTAQTLTPVNPFIDVINLPYDQARKRVFARFRSVYLKSLLKMNNDNITKAAKQSGLSRSSLHRMIKEDSEEK